MRVGMIAAGAALLLAPGAGAQDHSTTPPANRANSSALTPTPLSDDQAKKGPTTGPAPATAHEIRKPDWRLMPSMDDLWRLYPDRAKSADLNGGAIIGCVVTAAGALDSCHLESEYPAGFGFGQAALDMSSLFKMRPMTVDGQPVGGARVNVPIYFYLPHSRLRLINLSWQSAPTAEQVAAAYPAAARAGKVSGQVVLVCRVGDKQQLEKCRVASVDPDGDGFDGAALTLAGDFTAPAVDGQGTATAGDLAQVTIAFEPGVLDAIPMDGKPRWVRLPQAPDIVDVFPDKAQAAHVTQGVATLSCTVGPDGGLDRCGITKEDPAGLGFGAAMLSVSNKFQMAVWAQDGTPTVGRRVNVSVRFRAPAAGSSPVRSLWAREPTPADFAAAYPPAAADLGLSGVATIQCRVGEGGRLHECGVQKEEPVGYGFGQAALRVAPNFRASPGVGPFISFLVRFSMSMR